MQLIKEKIILLKKLKKFLGNEVWKLFILAVIIGILWFVVESSFVFVIQAFLQSIGILDSSKTILPTWFPKEASMTTLILIGFGIFRGAVVTMKYYLAITSTEFFIAHQKSQILELSLRNASNISTHETMLAYGEHTHSGSTALQQLTQLVNNFVSIVLFVMAGFFLTPKEFILSIFLLALVLIPIKYLNKKLSGLNRIIHEEKETANKILVHGLKNSFFLQIYHLIGFEIEKGQKSLKRHEETYRYYGKIGGMRNAFPQILGSIVIAVVAFISIKYFHTPGAKLLSFFYILIRMSQSASDFYATTGDLNIHLIALKNLYNWFQKLEALKLTSSSEEIKIDEKSLNEVSIDVEQLSFSYESNEILKNLNVKINPTEILLIRGESGAGKSTLLSLILGLNLPNSGKITINNLNPQSIRSTLADKTGYVGPEPFLIPGTVRDNLLYGHPHSKTITDDQLWASLKKAQLFNEIQSLPLKLNENLQEKTQFSTGQKQRLSIARALVRDPSLLILDEATANLDPDTESKFVELLSTIAKEMTTIIVTHKDSFNSIATKQITLYRN